MNTGFYLVILLPQIVAAPSLDLHKRLIQLQNTGSNIILVLYNSAVSYIHFKDILWKKDHIRIRNNVISEGEIPLLVNVLNFNFYKLLKFIIKSGEKRNYQEWKLCSFEN